jgi:two-component SAPR family response regulator
LNTYVQTIEQLLHEQRYQEIVFHIECMLMDGGSINMEWVKQLPASYVQNSPLLLKLNGDSFLRQGALVEAAAVLKQAVGGFAEQTFQSHLLDTMAQLASVYLRVGQWQDARTLLFFMQEEWERSETHVSSKVLHMLARGVFLLDNPVSEAKYYQEAKSLLIKEGSDWSSKELWLDLLLYDIHNMSEQEVQRILLCMDHKTKFDGSWHPYRHFAAGLVYSHKEDWYNAAACFSTVETEQLSYEFASACFMYQLEAAILSGQQMASDAWNTLDRITTQYETDLNLQLHASGLRYLEAKCKGNNDQILHWMTVLQSWADLTRNPIHLEWMKRWDEQGTKYYAKHRVTTDSADVGWDISCFGKMKFLRTGVEIKDIKWKRKKALELFVYLLIQPDYSSPKERVIETLLQQVSVDKINNQLYVMIYQLKQTLKQELNMEGALIVNDGTLSLCSSWINKVDSAKYVCLIRKGDELWKSDRQMAIQTYQQAQQLYGEFVPELHYSEWLEAYRESMSERQAGILRKMANYYRQLGELDLAEVHYTQQIEIRPLEEEGYQELIEFLMFADRRLEARRLYTKWEDICRNELGVAPLAETRKLAFGHGP